MYWPGTCVADLITCTTEAYSWSMSFVESMFFSRQTLKSEEVLPLPPTSRKRILLYKAGFNAYFLVMSMFLNYWTPINELQRHVSGCLNINRRIRSLPFHLHLPFDFFFFSDVQQDFVSVPVAHFYVLARFFLVLKIVLLFLFDNSFSSIVWDFLSYSNLRFPSLVCVRNCHLSLFVWIWILSTLKASLMVTGGGGIVPSDLFFFVRNLPHPHPLTMPRLMHKSRMISTRVVAFLGRGFITDKYVPLHYHNTVPVPMWLRFSRLYCFWKKKTSFQLFYIKHTW